MAFLFALAFCLSALPLMAEEAQDKKAPQANAPKADAFIVQERKDLPVTLTYPASVKAYNKIFVVSRVTGVLEKKTFKEGQKVSQGDTLYQIEDAIYKAKADAAKAALKMSEAVLRNAQSDWQRVQRLFEQKAVSQEKRDASLSAYEQGLASVSFAKATLRQAQIDLDYTKVKAPISGFAGLKLVDLGDLVSSNPPTKLLEITQNDKVYVEFSMPMSDYKRVRSGEFSTKNGSSIKVVLERDSVPLTKEGVVDYIDASTNAKTSIVKMRALFDNADNALMAGEFVRVATKNVMQKAVMTIPQKAVLQNPLGMIVFIEENGVVGVRPVVIGNVSGQNFVLAGGALKSGDKVLVNNFFRLKPGAPVSVDKILNQQGQ